MKTKEGGGYYCDPNSKDIRGMIDAGFPSEGYGLYSEGIVTQVTYSTVNSMHFYRVNDRSNWCSESGLEFVDEKLNKVINRTMSNIKEKFITALLPEPEKSFRKAGITNGDGLLTSDGQTIFLTWLLNQNKDAFNKEVVQPLLEEKE